MSRVLAASALALSLVAGLPTAASAQSYMAPAGIPAVTAPGGLEGAAAASNLRDYEGRSYRAVPGTGQVEGIDATGSIRVPHAGRSRTVR